MMKGSIRSICEIRLTRNRAKSIRTERHPFACSFELSSPIWKEALDISVDRVAISAMIVTLLTWVGASKLDGATHDQNAEYLNKLAQSSKRR
ncbi:hypothetical protein [Sphingobium lignivorans]|nr:hypothetical protein [Sphingobium lignivorans]